MSNKNDKTDVDTLCKKLLKMLEIDDHPSFDLQNLIAAYAMDCEFEGREFERLIQQTKTLEVKTGFIEERRVISLWTNRSPTAPGLYWYALLDHEGARRMCEVTVNADGVLILATRNSDEPFGKNLPVTQLQRVWAGPLPPPTGEAKHVDTIGEPGLHAVS